MLWGLAVQQNLAKITPGIRLKAAMMIAIAADLFQFVVFPYFIGGAFSPFNDVLDLGVCAVLTKLLGWHWEFLPALAMELVPGVDLVPLWTLAVANVYRKAKEKAVEAESAGA
jgi:hypothetical protein